MDEESKVVEVEQTTEESTPEVSTPEVEATTETTEVATSEQPVEADTSGEQPESRAQKRIRELNARLKEAEEKANYWAEVNQKPTEVELTPNDDGTIPADQLIDGVVAKLDQRDANIRKQEAQKLIERDALQAVAKYPELDTDNDLSQMVIGLAQANGITITAAADRVFSKINKERKVAEQKQVASQATRQGVSSPNGGKVSSGEPAPLDISNMTEEEKAANWGEIMKRYN